MEARIDALQRELDAEKALRAAEGAAAAGKIAAAKKLADDSAAALRLADERAQRLADDSAAALKLADERAAAERKLAALVADLASVKRKLAADQRILVERGKDVFFVRIDAMGGTAALSSSEEAQIDVRGPINASVHEVLAGDVDTAMCTSAWADFYRAHQSERTSECSTRYEHSHIHPIIHRILDTAAKAASRGAARLKLWHSRTKREPDFSCTLPGDNSLTLHSAVLGIEVRSPRELHKAVNRAQSFGRRRVCHLCEKARDADTLMSERVAALAIGTDGLHVVVLRIDSGVPDDEELFHEANPCPTIMTEPLPLLTDWAPDESPHVPEDMPAGFVALVHAMRAVCAAPFAASPLPSCRVSSRADGTGECTLIFGSRIDCGGSSDVYELQHAETSDADMSRALSRGDAVVKVARAATDQVRRSFDREATVLDALALNPEAQPTTPALLLRCVRVEPYARPGFIPRPLLVMSPRGVPLRTWVAQRAEDNPAARRWCATQAATSVLQALKHAHAAGFVHCDVRPSNVIVAPGGCEDRIVLVDWGSARRMREKIHACGVLPYVHDSVPFDSRVPGFEASPALDLAAVAYLWISIACGVDCRAPWGANYLTCKFQRRQWICEHAASDEHVAAMLEWLETCYAQSSAGTHEVRYSLPPIVANVAAAV